VSSYETDHYAVTDIVDNGDHPILVAPDIENQPISNLID